MAQHLVLRLEAPLISFGGEAIDNFGVVRDFPAASMVTGLIANALGYRRGDGPRHDRLQQRLVFGARLDRVAERMQDFQTAQLEAADKGWTRHGVPEGRAGGAGTYKGPHLRYRDYDTDACICIAVRLNPAGESPTLHEIATALDYPARPLFIGRKPCLPSARIVEGFIKAQTILEALKTYPHLTNEQGDHPVVLFWPYGEGEMECSQTLTITDQRSWRTGVHGGARRINRATVTPPVAEVAA